MQNSIPRQDNDIKNMSWEALVALCRHIGLDPYRARQLYQWVFQKHINDLEQMTSLPKQTRQELARYIVISDLEREHIAVSRDGSKKFVFRTADGYKIETVVIPERRHTTLCISTQIGCPLQCRFCFTGRTGLVRNLRVAEIVNQVHNVIMAEGLSTVRLNLVFMGMGEPLANYDNTLTAIRILMNPWGMNFSHRKITVSTAGIIPKMIRLGNELQVNLAISINAPTDELRSFLMPINKRYPLYALLEAAQRYPLSPRKRITFEYIIIKDVNDSPHHANILARILRRIPCKINLIPFNEHPAVDFRRPDEKTVAAFQKILHIHHFTAPIRYSKGADIAAACGQLGGGMV
ncbi:MAG: 23S rRNA (adenine(2503)-C(2))-methyltransferase RlmN [Desulfobacterota bacterium]|nr:23S rRNA (adenine(2503)-C(2))-methyltransferase RlmN [Thermodesulfobacteriota bacterium]